MFIYTWYGNNGLIMKTGEKAMYENLQGSYAFYKTGDGWKMAYVHESQRNPSISDPVKEFTKIETDWTSAIMNKDQNALDRLYAKEYAYTNLSGKVNNKEADIAEIMSGQYKLLALPIFTNIKAQLYGNMAVVTGIVTSKATLNGKDVSGSNQFTDVFIWREGRWQCISTQGNQIPKK